MLTDHSAVAWLLGSLVLTFLVTRLVTRLIHRGRGPFKDVSVGGVHIHHQVWGILLLMVVGALELVYQPGGSWHDVLAALFGVGIALTLDEFALWLRLDDVYWTSEGRRSVDAVLLAIVIGLLMLAGYTPLVTDEPGGWIWTAVIIAMHLLAAVVVALKGRSLLAVLGLFIPLFVLIVVFRVAKPTSLWAKRFYRPGSAKLAKSRTRFPAGKRNRWDPVVDLFTGARDSSPK